MDKLIENLLILDERFFHYLIHDAQSEEDKQSILKNGFRLSSNPHILSGIYTQPDIWYRKLGSGHSIKIFIKNSAKVFDNEADRPMSALSGLGTVEFNKIYVDLLNQLGYKLDYATTAEDHNWYTKNYQDINKFIDDKEHRKAYMKLLKSWLLNNGYTVYVNAGEVIILDLNAIYKISSL